MTNTLENLVVFQKSDSLSRLVWEIAQLIPKKYYYSLADQMIRSADSIGANIAEGYGRSTQKDRLRHCYYARGSIYELQFWLKKVAERHLIPEERIAEVVLKTKQLSYTLYRYMKYLHSKNKD